MFSTAEIKKILAASTLGILALTALSGCVVSDDPAVNAIAATAAVGTVAGLIYYSNDDGYYYDNRYNRLPRGYRPAYDARVRRIDSMDAYRRQRAFDREYARQRYQHRIMQERLENQRRENRIMHERLARQREQNLRMRQQMQHRRMHDEQIRDMRQRHRSEPIRQIQQRQHQTGAAERAGFRIDRQRPASPAARPSGRGPQYNHGRPAWHDL